MRTCIEREIKLWQDTRVCGRKCRSNLFALTLFIKARINVCTLEKTCGKQKSKITMNGLHICDFLKHIKSNKNLFVASYCFKDWKIVPQRIFIRPTVFLEQFQTLQRTEAAFFAIISEIRPGLLFKNRPKAHNKLAKRW